MCNLLPAPKLSSNLDELSYNISFNCPALHKAFHIEPVCKTNQIEKDQIFLNHLCHWSTTNFSIILDQRALSNLPAADFGRSAELALRIRNRHCSDIINAHNVIPRGRCEPRSLSTSRGGMNDRLNGAAAAIPVQRLARSNPARIMCPIPLRCRWLIRETALLEAR